MGWDSFRALGWVRHCVQDDETEDRGCVSHKYYVNCRGAMSLMPVVLWAHFFDRHHLLPAQRHRDKGTVLVVNEVTASSDLPIRELLVYLSIMKEN